MALLNEHIFHLKEVLSHGAASDDSRLSDRHIYHILKYLRAKKVKEKADKSHQLSPFLYNTVDCFPMELAEPGDCGCIITGCKVLKSTYDLPMIVTARNRILLDVYTLLGEKIDYLPKSRVRNISKTRTMKDKRFWYVHNKKIIVIDPDNMLENISIEGIFNDPLELMNISSCAANNNACYDPYTEDFSLTDELAAEIYASSYTELYKIMMMIPMDATSNAADDAALAPKQK